MEIGGCDNLALLYRPSRRIEWSRVLEYGPEIIVLTFCGFEPGRCEEEDMLLAKFEGLHDLLPAAKEERIYPTDGSAYFSRLGPRIVESLEIMAHLINPEIFSPPLLADAFSALRLTPEGGDSRLKGRRVQRCGLRPLGRQRQSSFPLDLAVA